MELRPRNSATAVATLARNTSRVNCLGSLTTSNFCQDVKSRPWRLDSACGIAPHVLSDLWLAGALSFPSASSMALPWRIARRQGHSRSQRHCVARRLCGFTDFSCTAVRCRKPSSTLATHSWGEGEGSDDDAAREAGLASFVTIELATAAV